MQRPMRAAIILGLLVLAGRGLAAETTPAGQTLTPAAAKGAIFQPLMPGLPADPQFQAGQASAMALSPDGKTLLILTSGFNRMNGPDGRMAPDRSMEYVFVFDVGGPAPVQRQVLTARNTFLGLAWAPSGDRFYVSGGVDDDVLEFVARAGVFGPDRTFPLGHKVGLGLQVQPEVAGLAVSPDGRRLLAANFQNDSISLIDLSSGAVLERDLRPGANDPAQHGLAGGTFPRAVAWTGVDKAYVASERDREVIALDLGGATPRIGARIAVNGQPTALLAGPAGRLYAAMDNTDSVAVIDTRAEHLLENIPSAAPGGSLPPGLGGAGSNALALTPDGSTLLVSNGGENAIAVIALDPRGARSRVVGLMPTGWYPTAVAMRPDGREIFAVNGKSNTGPAPRNCRDTVRTDPASRLGCASANQYVWQLEKAGFLALPTPTPAELGRLTRQVAINDHFAAALDASGAATLGFLKDHIHHVVFVVKENRTYDQVLGDLEVGDGDPNLAIFGRAMTPNQHALARRFVDLDAFFDSGESSNTGWNWTLAGRTNDFTEREAPVNYAGRGLQYDQEGSNRNLNVGLASTAERLVANPLGPHDPDMLPGARDVAAPDGPQGAAGQGYLWDQALKAGLAVRNWGFYGDLALYDRQAGALRTPLIRDPWKSGVKVFVPAKASLMSISDLYFRGFDQSFPDFWRFKEWEREFDGFVTTGAAPALMMVRLPHDHTGDFGEGIDGVNTVETEIADNDYAVGLLVEKIAKSPFARDTLIFVVEDDAQDGPDHVDAHRSVAFVAGPYVRQGAVVSRRHDTVDLVATIEGILGLAPMGLNDALAEPMTELFDPRIASWTFAATVPGALRSTMLPLPPASAADNACAPTGRPAQYWRAAMAGQDFSREDRLDTAAFNQALWRGLKGDLPYPAGREGRDLRENRRPLLAAGAVATDIDCDPR